MKPGSTPARCYSTIYCIKAEWSPAELNSKSILYWSHIKARRKVTGSLGGHWSVSTKPGSDFSQFPWDKTLWAKGSIWLHTFKLGQWQGERMYSSVRRSKRGQWRGEQKRGKRNGVHGCHCSPTHCSLPEEGVVQKRIEVTSESQLSFLWLCHWCHNVSGT